MPGALALDGQSLGGCREGKVIVSKHLSCDTVKHQGTHYPILRCMPSRLRRRGLGLMRCRCLVFDEKSIAIVLSWIPDYETRASHRRMRPDHHSHAFHLWQWRPLRASLVGDHDRRKGKHKGYRYSAFHLGQGRTCKRTRELFMAPRSDRARSIAWEAAWLVLCR